MGVFGKDIAPHVRDIYVERLDPERVLEQHAMDSMDIDTPVDAAAKRRAEGDPA